MNERERTALEADGELCLRALEKLFNEDLGKRNFRGANVWLHEYCGAAKMLEALRLISAEEYAALSDAVHNRLSAAKYPELYPKEAGR